MYSAKMHDNLQCAMFYSHLVASHWDNLSLSAQVHANLQYATVYSYLMDKQCIQFAVCYGSQLLNGQAMYSAKTHDNLQCAIFYPN